MTSAANAPAAAPGLRPGDIVSRCGLLCNTCSAYITGACPGCPNLETGECVLRDCADLKGTSCLDCQAPSCHHFEAYTWRRRIMNAKAKQFLRLVRPQGAATGGGCGCGSGGGCAAAGGGGGGCSGCSVKGGCPGSRLAVALAAVE